METHTPVWETMVPTMAGAKGYKAQGGKGGGAKRAQNEGTGPGADG